MRGRGYCPFHGGKSPLATTKSMPGFYKRYLTKTLATKLDELTAGSHSEQVSIYEELALMRIMASDAVVLVGAALDNGEPGSRALAASVLREALDGVKEFVLAASRIEKDAEDKVSLQVMSLFVLQITRAIYRVLGDDIATAKRIEKEIHDTVRLPRPGVDPNVNLDGTTITPDQVVAEMDESISGADA